MRSSTLLVCDEGHVISLLHTCPSELLELLREGVGRWQSKQILGHLPEHLEGGEEVGHRVKDDPVASAIVHHFRPVLEFLT